jgi:hypothetical protein
LRQCIYKKEMPPYEPPDAHYAHINIPQYDTDTVFKFIGKDGYRFKKLTSELGVYYIYYHHEDKRISVHGPWTAIRKMPCQTIVNRLDEFVKMCSENLTNNDSSE